MGRFPPGTLLPILPGITPGPKDRLRRRPPRNLLELDDSPSGSTSSHLSGITPGPQDSTFLSPSSGSHIYTTRYAVCVCVCVSLKTILRPSLLCFSFQRTIHTAWYCVNFQRTIGVPSAFKRNKFYTAGISKCFTENSFIPPPGFTSTDKLSSTGIVFHQSKTLSRSMNSYFVLFPEKSGLFSE